MPATLRKASRKVVVFCSAMTCWPTTFTVCGVSRIGSEYLAIETGRAEVDAETSMLSVTVFSSSTTEVLPMKRQVNSGVL